MTQASKCCCTGLRDDSALRLFRALCEPSRIDLVVRLAQCGCELSVSQVAECCPTDLSVVSRHLGTLRDAGILKATRRGKEVFYSLQRGALVRSLRAIADEIENGCAHVEEVSNDKAS